MGSSVSSATQEVQQLFLFSNSRSSETLSLHQLRLSIMQSLHHLLLLGLLVFVLVGERHVDAKPALFLVETRDSEPAPPIYELPADDGIEMKIARRISDRLRTAEADAVILMKNWQSWKGRLLLLMESIKRSV